MAQSNQTLPRLPPALLASLREVGPRWSSDLIGNIKLMLDQFEPVLAQSPREGITVESDIAYGPDPRHQLDVFLPTDNNARRPALLYFHGGAFIEGRRNRSPNVHACILHFFARHGIIGINVGYRLAPHTTYPGASLDVGAAATWTRENASTYGIDSNKIFIMGHSSGGAHVASYIYDRRLWQPGAPGIAGAILVGARVRVDNRTDNPIAHLVEKYYGTDSSLYDDRSGITHVSSDSVPTFIAFAEYENPLLDVYSLELAHKIASLTGRAPDVLRLSGHNHMSAVLQMNTADDTLGPAVYEFIRRVSGD